MARGGYTPKLNTSKNNYGFQIITLLDLLDAHTQWQAAYSNSAQYKIREVEYLKAIGKLE